MLLPWTYVIIRMQVRVRGSDTLVADLHGRLVIGINALFQYIIMSRELMVKENTYTNHSLSESVIRFVDEGRKEEQFLIHVSKLGRIR